MRQDDPFILLTSVGHVTGQAAGGAPADSRLPFGRIDPVSAGLVALGYCARGMRTGAAVRAVARAFGMVPEIVALNLGRARARGGRAAG